MGDNQNHESSQQPNESVAPQDARVVWTPEDATHFLSAAIQESQRPLLDALRRSGVPRSVVICGLLAMLLLVGGAGILGYKFYRDGLRAIGSLRTENRTATQRQMAAVKEAGISQSRNEQLKAQLSQLRESVKLATRERDEARAESRRERIAEGKAETQYRSESQSAAQQAANEIRTLREGNIRLKATQPERAAALTRQMNEIITLKKANTAQIKITRNMERHIAALLAERDGLRLEMEGTDDERAALRKQLRAARARLLLPRSDRPIPPMQNAPAPESKVPPTQKEAPPATKKPPDKIVM